MNENIYLHTINNGRKDYYDSRHQLEVLKSILKDGAVLSRRLQGYTSDMLTNFSGLDYISLSDYEKREVCNKQKEYYNSFYAYVRRGLSLSFPQDKVKVIEPELIRICSRSISDFETMRYLGLSEDKRFTDLPDEVQVKDKLSLENFNGLIFPTDNFMHSKVLTKKSKMIKLLKEELKVIREILNEYNYNVNIYDVDTLKELNEESLENIALKR